MRKIDIDENPFTRSVTDDESGLLSKFEYNPDTLQLRVTFATGATYGYFRVSADNVIRMVFAQSTGKYFNRYIRDSHDYVRLD